MDVELASASIDRLIDSRHERRGQDDAEAMWRRSEERQKAKLREQNRQDWQMFYAALAASLRDSARKYEQKAQKLNGQIGAP